MQVADLVRAGEQVPGHVPGPGGSVDEIGGPAERGDLRQDAVDGRLERRDLAGQAAPCSARMSASWPSKRPSLSARAASTAVCWT